MPAQSLLLGVRYCQWAEGIIQLPWGTWSLWDSQSVLHSGVYPEHSCVKVPQHPGGAQCTHRQHPEKQRVRLQHHPGCPESWWGQSPVLQNSRQLPEPALSLPTTLLHLPHTSQLLQRMRGGPCRQRPPSPHSLASLPRAGGPSCVPSEAVPCGKKQYVVT